MISEGILNSLSEVNWDSISCGRYHSMAIESDGSLWSWGNISTSRRHSCVGVEI